MQRLKLEDLPRETLVELAKMYSRNWQSLDALWFGSVEAEYGLEAAARLDLKNWEKQSVTEAERIKKALKLGGGLSSVLMVLSFMSWQLTSPLFEIEEESTERVVFRYARCVVQEGRRKQGKPEFHCKPMKLTLLSNIAKVVEPRAVVNCLSAPPDPRGQDFWCRWEVTLK
ncbi:MAG: DUF6125 family protein [Dehalococcoidia bacterium]|nr:DUF6125 family protein [Dehalococcoidia bacterium]